MKNIIMICATLVLFSCMKETYIFNKKDKEESLIQKNSEEKKNFPLVSGLHVQVNPNLKEAKGYEIRWSTTDEWLPQIQFEIYHVEKKSLKMLPFFLNEKKMEQEFVYPCSSQEDLTFQVKKYYEGNLVTTQDIEIVCPMDISMNHDPDEKLLDQELKNSKRKKIFIGQWIFPHDKEYVIKLRYPVTLVVKNLYSFQGIPTLTLDLEKEKKESLQFLSRLSSLWTSYQKIKKTDLGEHTTAVEILRQHGFSADNEKEIPELSPSKIKERIPRLEIVVTQLQGSLAIKSHGFVGGQGLPWDHWVSGSYRYEVTKPPPKAQDGKDEQTDVVPMHFFGSTDIVHHSCIQKSAATEGFPGINGTLKGFPGTDGGSGLSNIPFFLSVEHLDPLSQIQVYVEPGEGGSFGLGGPGQPGGEGGIGGRVYCSIQKMERKASGKKGEDGPKGSNGVKGLSSDCAPFTLSSNILGQLKNVSRKNCPNLFPIQYEKPVSINWESFLVTIHAEKEVEGSTVLLKKIKQLEKAQAYSKAVREGRGHQNILNEEEQTKNIEEGVIGSGVQPSLIERGYYF
jgi:hypothetical protein